MTNYAGKNPNPGNKGYEARAAGYAQRDREAEIIAENKAKPQTVEELEYIVDLYAKTRAMNKTLSPMLARAEADAIAKLEAAKAQQSTT